MPIGVDDEKDTAEQIEQLENCARATCVSVRDEPVPKDKNPSAEPAHLLDQRAREAHAGSTVAYARTGKVPTPLTLTGTAVKVNPESGS